MKRSTKLTNLWSDRSGNMTKRNERRELTSDSKDIKNVMRKYYEKLFGIKLNNLDKILKFLERHEQPKHFLWKWQFCSVSKSRLGYN